MKPFLSLVIPAYNEATRIRKSLDRAFEYLTAASYTSEIIVVDDGSHDSTSEVVRANYPAVKLITLKKNQGKGAAVRNGMLEASGEVIVFTDADFSTPVYELAKVLNSLNNGADVCIGSRALDETMIKLHQPFYREAMGKTFNKMVQMMLFSGIKDTQCGFKAFTKNSVDAIFTRAKINGFGFDVEILYLARKSGLTIDQVSVEWYNDQRSTVNPIKDSILMIIELFRIKRLHKK